MNTIRGNSPCSTFTFWRMGLVIVTLLLAALLAVSLPAEKTVHAKSSDSVEIDVSARAGNLGWTMYPITNQSTYPDTESISTSKAQADWFLPKLLEVTTLPGSTSSIALGCNASKLTPGTYYTVFEMSFSGADQFGTPVSSTLDFVLKCTVTA